MKTVLDAGREFFVLPQEEKGKIGISKGDGSRAYQVLHRNFTLGKTDHQEAIDYYARKPGGETQHVSTGLTKVFQPNGEAVGLLEGDNQWPNQPAEFKGTMETWIDKMKVLGTAVIHAMSDGLGCTPDERTDLLGRINDSFWCLRVIGYPPLPDGLDGISCGAHKDYGCLTFLLADPCPGSLQVQPHSTTSPTASTLSANAPAWVPLDPKEGSIIVNIGEMWQRWSGGMYPATLHQVIHRAPTYRVSVPFFFEPNFDAPTSVLQAARRKCAEEGMEAKDWQSGTYGEFLLGKIRANFGYDGTK